MKVYLNGELFLEAEVAESCLAKSRGLMFREIDEDEGFLMTFDKTKKWSIWMPFTKQDLGVIFLNGDREIVDKMLAEKITLNPKTWKIYKPEEECKYILECHPERMDEIKAGDKLKWRLG